jgi:hypothetical protein
MCWSCQVTTVFCFFPCSQCVPIMFPSCSHQVPAMFPNTVPWMSYPLRGRLQKEIANDSSWQKGKFWFARKMAMKVHEAQKNNFIGILLQANLYSPGFQQFLLSSSVFLSYLEVQYSEVCERKVNFSSLWISFSIRYYILDGGLVDSSWKHPKKKRKQRVCCLSSGRLSMVEHIGLGHTQEFLQMHLIL